MKKHILLTILASAQLSMHAKQQYENEIILRFADEPLSKDDLPANFRTTEDKLRDKKVTKGLDKVNASGSSEFFVDNVPTTVRELRKRAGQETLDITVFDLRSEAHCFINGVPYFWLIKPNTDMTTSERIYASYNLGKTTQEIEQDEINKIAILSSQGTFTSIYATNSDDFPETMDYNTQQTFAIETIINERDLTKQHGLHYVRLPILDFHAPTPEQIDTFVRYLNTHKNTWKHYHCNAGKGRTTTLLAFNDMIHNAKDVDFEIIIKRQYALGGDDLTDVSETSGMHAKRLKIVQSFYQYCKENNDDYATSYSTWLKNRAALSPNTEMPKSAPTKNAFRKKRSQQQQS